MQAETRPPTAGDAALDTPLRELVRAEQLRAHYAQLPSMAVAQTAGALFTAWVLWDAVDNRVLVAGLCLVALLSAGRLWLYRRYTMLAADARAAPRWRVIAVAGAFASGCVWGSAAPFLYPPQQPQYAVYLVVLLTLLPVVPVAALAAYLPAFYAYALPCLLPFIVTLALRPSRAEHFAALLLVMMMLAMLAFARRYARSLADAIRLRAQLARQSAALQAAIDHKTRFIATASHDLRQPVHAMGLFLQTLRGAGDARIAEAVGHLEASQRSLRAMLANLLDFSRLEAGVVAPQLRSFAVAPLLRQLAEEFGAQAAAKGLNFRCRPGNAVVHSDPVLLERMLRNLLGNALKYTEHGGVLLACRRRGAQALLQVVDTGVGIEPGDIDAVFDAFALAPAKRLHDADSLGLGLAIVRQSAALLGHTLRLRSVPGRGSVFSLTVARAAGAAPAVAAVADAAARLPSGVVWIVDDNAAVREGTAALLRQWGLQVVAGASFEPLLDPLARAARAPDVLLADDRLAQGESGLSGVQRLRAHLGRDVATILISGDTAPQRIREVHQAGHVLLHKPVDPAVLRACLSEALAPALPAPTAAAPR